MARPNPIEHVVIILKENHTFDNYFGTFPGARGDNTLDKFPLNMTRPDPMPIRINHESWMKNHKNPANKGGQGNMQFVEEHIPMYFKYAADYTLRLLFQRRRGPILA